MKFKDYRMYIMAILLVEGFVALSFQMLFMRKLLMNVGSSVNNIGVIIGVILIMMALGYRQGGLQKDFDVKYIKDGDYSKYLKSISRKIGLNFIIVAVISAVALNEHIIDLVMFYDMGIGSLVIYSILFISPIIFLMASTVPYIVRFFNDNRAENAASKALYYSTIGSFLGSVVTANVLFSYLGVHLTTMLVVLLIFETGVLSLLLKTSDESVSNYKFINVIYLVFSLFIILIFLISGSGKGVVAYNDYYNYRVVEEKDYKIFQVNKSHSSIIYEDGLLSPYVEVVRNIIFNVIGVKNQDILVIGAGGFVAGRGLEESGHKFTYVDVDPKMQDIAERNFLNGKINGNYIASDGRAYLKKSDKKYDVIFLDAFSDAKSIPENLSTIQFFEMVREDIKKDGWFVANVIADVDFNEEYSRNIYRTINSVFPFCLINVQNMYSVYSNVIYTCKNSEDYGSIYIDDKNKSNIEYGNMRIFKK